MWFVRFPWPAAAASITDGLGDVYRSDDGDEGCCYLADGPSAPRLAGGIAVRLAPLRTVAGEAETAVMAWHYVVATDVAPAHEDEFNDWYEQEHLPGLAAVPGTVRAARYRVVTGDGPRYLACYDLVAREVLGSPAWLAIRGTAWSARVRPAFVNTRRTLYRRLTPTLAAPSS